MIESKKSPPTMWDAHGGTDLIWEMWKPAAIVTELMNLVKRAGTVQPSLFLQKFPALFLAPRRKYRVFKTFC